MVVARSRMSLVCVKDSGSLESRIPSPANCHSLSSRVYPPPMGSLEQFYENEGGRRGRGTRPVFEWLNGWARWFPKWRRNENLKGMHTAILFNTSLQTGRD